MQQRDLFHRDFQRIGGDLRQHRFQSLTDAGGADLDGDATIRIQTHLGVFTRSGRAAFDKAGQTDAVITTVDESTLQRALLVPVELLEAAIKALAVIAAVEFGIGRMRHR